MSALAMVGLVMSREIRQRLRSRGFAITTGLLCVAIIGIGVLNRILDSNDAPVSFDVAVVGGSPADFENAAQQTAAALDIVVRFQEQGDRAGIEQRLRDGDLDVAIDASAGELVSNNAPSERLAAVMNAAWQAAESQAAAERAGLDDAQIAAVLSPAALRTVDLDGDDDSDDEVAKSVGFAAAVLLFISINAFGGMVLTGVVEEKTTGVVEVLLGHVRANELLAGKVFGIGAVAMTQFVAAVAAGLVALSISAVTVPSAVWFGLPTTVLWFLAGFVLYSTLFALAGSFVSRQEDAQSAAAPISIVFTGAYLMVFAFGNNPHELSSRIVSVLPPFAPLLMPLRISSGAASVVEIIVSIVLLLAAMIAMLRLAGAIYGRTLLHRGSRLSWKDALRMKSS
ncbi:MAG: ABC transporter permease [Ilumatobacteraceae bacterium]